MNLSARSSFWTVALVVFCALCARPEICAAQTSVSPTTDCSHIETAEFSFVLARMQAEVRSQGADHVLLVVDIDNTLLAMDQSLGSDQWFHWQEQLLREQPMSPDRVADDFAGLLQVQGILFSLSKMHPPEPAIPSLVKSIQDLRCRVIVLTSRGPEFRSFSERELQRNKYDFAESALAINERRRGRFKPYDKTKPCEHGLSADELKKLDDPRDVTYSNGLMMVAGQHKGFMLKTLLARSDHRINTIVFVDDHQKHTDRMHEAFECSGIRVVSFRYSREDVVVDRFKSSDKHQVVRQWKSLRDTIHSTLKN